MPLESATYISQLVPTNPAHTDGLNQADSHMRLIKSVLQASFPNVTGPVTASLANLSGGYVPVGAIIMWYGTLASLPSNYTVCNGANGTPDLLDRFPISAGLSYSLGQLGGSTSTDSQGTHSHPASITDVQGNHGHNITEAGDHNHGGTQSHTLVLAEIPSHEHEGGFTMVTQTNSGAPWFSVNGGGSSFTLYLQADSNEGGNGGHSHGLNTDGGHVHFTDNEGAHAHNLELNGDGAHAHNATPPFFGVYFVMRMS